MINFIPYFVGLSNAYWLIYHIINIIILKVLDKIKTPLIKKLFLILFIAMFVQFFLSLSLNLFGYYVDLKTGILKSMNEKIDKIKSSVERLTSLGIPIRELPSINEELENEITDEFTIFISIVDDSGYILFHSDPILIGSRLPLRHDELLISKTSKITLQPYGVINVISKPITDGKMTKTGYIVAAFKDDIIYKKVLFVLFRMTLSSALAGFLGLFLIYYFYKKEVFNHVSALLNQVNKIKDGIFEEAQLTETESEFSSISEAMNKMVVELKKSFEEKEELLSKLYKEEEKLRKIIEKTNIGIAVIRDEKIVFVNPGFYKIFHFNAESQVIGQSVTKIIPDESMLLFKNLIKDVLENGENCFLENLKLMDLQGKEIFCSVEANLLETSEWGRKVISLTFQDITERIRFTTELKQKNKELENLINKYQSTQIALQISNEKLENALITIEKANEELKKIDSLKDVFFSTISHELKTPISLIQGYISIIKNDPVIKKSNVSYDIVEAIERASKRLLNLTEEIMELLKLRAGKITLNPTLTSIKMLLQSLLPEFDHFLKTKNIEIIMTEMNNLPILNIDVKKIETVLRNIIVNAIKFTKENGKIYISADTVQEGKTQYVRLAIRDEGCGISKFNLDKVFNEFFTLPPPPSAGKTNTIKGSGLGLSIAKGFVEAHKGKIWVESEGYDPETFPGSTFYIMLPAAENIS